MLDRIQIQDVLKDELMRRGCSRERIGPSRHMRILDGLYDESIKLYNM